MDKEEQEEVKVHREGEVDIYQPMPGNLLGLDSETDEAEESDGVGIGSGAQRVLEKTPTTTTAQRIETTCRFFLKGICQFEADECKYSHELPSSPGDGSAQPDKIEECKTFNETGTCPYNEDCWFIHKKRAPANESSSIGQTQCCVCFEDVIELKRKFALLPNCEHTFCMDCMKGWRGAGTGLAGKMKCPACRSPVELIVPSWEKLSGTMKEERFRLYKDVLSKRSCRFYDRSKKISKCPFGPHCFYGHFDEQGVDVKEQEVVKDNRRNMRASSGGGGGISVGSIQAVYDNMFAPEDEFDLDAPGISQVLDHILLLNDPRPEAQEHVQQSREQLHEIHRILHQGDGVAGLMEAELQDFHLNEDFVDDEDFDEDDYDVEFDHDGEFYF